MEVHGHVPERRALGEPWELRPGTLAGDRAQERKEKQWQLLSPLLSLHCCTSLELTHEQNLRSVQKDVYLFPLMILPLFFPSDHEIISSKCLLKSFTVVLALFLTEVASAPQKYGN